MWCISGGENKLEKYLQQQKIDKVVKLLNRGANPNVYSSSSNCSYLCIAITQRNEDLVRAMLKKGASPNLCTWGEVGEYLNEYPIQIASTQGHLGIVKALLEYGADINIGQDSKIGTALHVAAKLGHTEITRYLLDHGADIIAIDRALNTPLHAAASYGYTSTAQILLERGAPVNAKNLDLITPLHCAASSGVSIMAEVLLEEGADPAFRDVKKRSPLDVAKGKVMTYILKKYELEVHELDKTEFNSSSTRFFSDNERVQVEQDIEIIDITDLKLKQKTWKKVVEENNNIETECNVQFDNTKSISNNFYETDGHNCQENHFRRCSSLHRQSRKRRKVNSTSRRHSDISRQSYETRKTFKKTDNLVKNSTGSILFIAVAREHCSLNQYTV